MTTLRKAMPFTLFCAALLVCPLLAAQTQDCSFTYTFTGNATQTAVSNLSGNTPCVNWRVTLSTTGTQTATVTFQTSPDNSTWTAVPNTVCSSTVQPPCILQGTNPIVGTQGMMYTASYGTYVRIVVTGSTGTGTGTVRAYGVKGASASLNFGGGGGGGSAAIACVANPGNTTGTYRQQCQTAGGTVYACNNAAGCTVAADWVAIGPIAGTSGGIPYFNSGSTWASSAQLGLNRVVLGGGAGGAPTVTATDTTTTHALFATAGAPAFRAIALSDLPTIPGAVACPENPISMTIGNTYTCTDNLGVATGKFLWCQDPNSTPVNAAVQVSWAGATINTFTWLAAGTETVNCYASKGTGGGGGGGGGGYVGVTPNLADYTIESETATVELASVLDPSRSGIVVFGSNGQVSVRHLTTPLAPGAYTVTAQFSAIMGAENPQSIFVKSHDSVSGKSIAIALQYNGGQFIYLVEYDPGGATPFTVAASTLSLTSFYGLIYMRIKDDGANVFYQISADGILWRTLYTTANTAWAVCNQPGWAIIGSASYPPQTWIASFSITTP